MSRRPGPPCRRFTLLDAMIVVAFLSLVFVGIDSEWNTLIEYGWPIAAREIAGFSLMLASALMLVLRLRRPRPTIRRLTRQPGAVACFAVLAWTLIFGMVRLIHGIRVTRGIPTRTVGEWLWFLLEPIGAYHAYVLPIAWGLLALGGRWRPERGWIDRTGRVVGWAWIVWGLASMVLPWFL